MQTQYALHSNATCGAGQATYKPHVAIQFARARYISRSTGGSAVRSAAYNDREAITAERTGEVFYFRHRDAPEHHEVLLPAGADGGSATARCCGMRRRRQRSARTRRSPARSCWRCRPIKAERPRTGSSWRGRLPSSTSSPRAWRCSSTCTRRMTRVPSGGS